MANLRNNTVDRRRLPADMRQSYRSGQREQALSRVRAYRGQIAQERNSLPFRTERRPGSGGFNSGQSVQINRQQKVGQEKRRSLELRNENLV